MATVYSRAPLRLSLSGGGTDIKSFSDQYGGAVINFTINKYVYCAIKTSNQKKIIFKSFDLQLEDKLEINTISLKEKKPLLTLHYYTYLKMMTNYNNGKFLPIEIETMCENPPGSGLGTSSALVVSMVKAFDNYLNLNLDNLAIAKLAYEIERVDCGLSGGQQDQYAGTYGGFNFFEFKKNGDVNVIPLVVSESFIKKIEHTGFLYFSGISRESAKIIEDQKKSIKGDSLALNAMLNLKKLTIQQNKIIQSLNFNKLMSSLNELWSEKKKTSKNVSNDHIESVMNRAKELGAIAGKVSGAGGGGFFLFFVEDHNRLALKSSLVELGGFVENFSFTYTGAESWRD